jgi:hypothetical protein
MAAFCSTVIFFPKNAIYLSTYTTDGLEMALLPRIILQQHGIPAI